MAEFLIDYVERALSLNDRERFERHLTACDACRAYLRSYEFTIRIGRAALLGEAEALCAEIPEDLVRAILAARAA